MATARLSYARRIDLAALLESQQPVIDLHTQEYEVATRKFLKAIQAYTTRGIEEIKNRQTKHAQELKKITEKKASLEAETTACKLKEIELMKSVSSFGVVLHWVDFFVLHKKYWRRKRQSGKKLKVQSMS